MLKRILTLCLILLAVSCSKEKPEVVVEPTEAQKLKAHEEKLKKNETEDLFRSMKSETMNFLYQFGVAVRIPENIRNNSTEQYKVALNLGVSLTDAISAVSNKSEKEFLAFAGNINEYGERLNVSESILNKYSMIKDAVAVAEWDKVEALLYDIEESVFEELRNNDMTQEALLIMAAGWVEGVHVSAKSLSENVNKEAAEVLRKQNFVAYLQSNLENLSDDLSNKAEVVRILNALPQIEKIMNKPKTDAYTKADIDKILSITTPIHDLIVQ
jgi:uncharacterized pyridoxamine 5'-phosphate oxidase family protein